jgi:hypothetical protein
MDKENVSIHNGVYSAIEKNEIMSFAGKKMDGTRTPDGK